MAGDYRYSVEIVVRVSVQAGDAPEVQEQDSLFFSGDRGAVIGMAHDAGVAAGGLAERLVGLLDMRKPLRRPKAVPGVN